MPKFVSTAIKRAEYDPEAMRLQLWFPDGGPYDFCHVPQRIYDGLCSARSKGTFYNNHIRDKYDC